MNLSDTRYGELNRLLLLAFLSFPVIQVVPKVLLIGYIVNPSAILRFNLLPYGLLHFFHPRCVSEPGSMELCVSFIGENSIGSASGRKYLRRSHLEECQSPCDCSWPPARWSRRETPPSPEAQEIPPSSPGWFSSRIFFPSSTNECTVPWYSS